MTSLSICPCLQLPKRQPTEGLSHQHWSHIDRVMSACIAHPCRRKLCDKSSKVRSASQIIRLSHIGARPISLPPDVTCTWHKKPDSSTTQSLLRFSGPMGVREVPLPEGILPSFQSIGHQDTMSRPTGQTSEGAGKAHVVNTLLIQCQNSSDARQRSSWGLTAALAANCVQGVSGGSSIELRLVGVGYRASVEMQDPSPSVTTATQQQQVLVLRLGYPRPVRIAIPAGMLCEVPSPTEIKITGNDKAALAQLAAKIRTFRPPEPYNGKGIFVGSEKIQRKEVKKK